MFGMATAYLLTELKAALTRKLAIYGLMAVALLLVVFAAGYGLASIHSLLAYRYGPIAASLIVAGALLALAVICFSAAQVMRRSPKDRSRSTVRPSAETRSVLRTPRRKDVVALAGTALALAGSGLAVVTFVRKRRAPWTTRFGRRG